MADVDPHLFVIFGATGDLTRRKLIPSLYRVMTEDAIGDAINVLGVGRTDWSDHDFRTHTVQTLSERGYDPIPVTNWCNRHVFYQEIPQGTDDLTSLRQRLETLESTHDLPGNRILYLALPPRAVPSVVRQLGEAGLANGPGWTRLVVEKPFGSDLATARELNRIVHEHFDESQVYRIDHYLGKETVQNLLTFRFANLLFETAWHRDRIASVEITVAESLGIEGRASYYDHSGVIKDMLQNHVTQLVSLIAMEPPNAFQADDIRDEKVQLLRAITPIALDQVTLGQYRAGQIDGEHVEGYTDVPGVDPGSATPTFVALRIGIANWRWEGVPFFIRTGKRMPTKSTQIVVTFQNPPVCLFHGVNDSCEAHPNVILLTLQPNEGFELRFGIKGPGEPPRLAPQPLHFEYEEAFNKLPDAYQTLIHDVMQGDQTLFVRADEVEASWKLYADLLEKPPQIETYPAGSWGPHSVGEKLGIAKWTNRR